MTERQFFHKIVKPALEGAGYNVMRVEDYGIPDVIASNPDHLVFLELKTMEHAPVREGTPWRIGNTAHQQVTQRQLDPRAYVLLGLEREDEWYILKPGVPETVSQDDFVKWVWAGGSGKYELGQTIIELSEEV